MELLIVDSPVVFAIGYEAKRGDLEIQFKDGSAFLYLGVPAPLYLELMNAPSKETYFNEKIKNQFVYRKLA